MADNNASASAPKSEGGSTAPPNNRINSSQQDGPRGGGRGRGRRNSHGGRGGFGGSGRDNKSGSKKGFGSRGNNRGGHNGKNKGDMGRGEYNRTNVDKRKRNDDSQQQRRQRIDGGVGKVDAPFSKEEIEAEVRKPKRKVAVMIGYAGSGYKGMQINGDEKTIEGDLFKAFVAAGAISKANADDPKKSSLVRCARTDKGVHAAGNVISLKLIMEDPKIIETINENLPPQIRVWGMERTNGSFSCYQSCDSRWYEYLIPTFSFLPPHPQSFLGKKLVESAKKEGVYETYKARQEDVWSFWDDTYEACVKPILEKFDLETRKHIMAAIHSEKEDSDGEKPPKDASKKGDLKVTKVQSLDTSEPASIDDVEFESSTPATQSDTLKRPAEEDLGEEPKTKKAKPENKISDIGTADVEMAGSSTTPAAKGGDVLKPLETEAPAPKVFTPVELAIKEVKAAYIIAKKAYRISPSRRNRVQEALIAYVGTRNFHNYTIQKHSSDPSAKRHIRSFNVQPEPVIINDTEWLSLKVHGQSFMMHQIRKMVAMAALVVRCGTPMSIIQESYGAKTISIPKAPGLGLLLEAPVFESYNEKAVKDFQRETIDFKKYEKEMLEFKQREIYDRIFREEEKDHQFHDFFHHVDHYRSDYFLWVTASGLSAANQNHARKGDADASDDDEADANGEEG